MRITDLVWGAVELHARVTSTLRWLQVVDSDLSAEEQVSGVGIKEVDGRREPEPLAHVEVPTGSDNAG
jgi:hypothetical protein